MTTDERLKIMWIYGYISSAVALLDSISAQMHTQLEKLNSMARENTAPAVPATEAAKNEKELTPILSANGEKLSIGDYVLDGTGYVTKIQELSKCYARMQGDFNWVSIYTLTKLHPCNDFRDGHRVLTVTGKHGEINDKVDGQYLIELDSGGIKRFEAWELFEEPKEKEND